MIEINCVSLSPCTVRVYFPFCRDAQATVEVGKRLHIGRTSVPSMIQTRIGRGRALSFTIYS